MSQIQVRKMEQDNLSSVVEVHLKAFNGFFLTFLGPAFLLVLYRSILFDPSGISFIAEDHGQIVGFVAGTAEPNGFYHRLLKKHWWDFARASTNALFHKPSILWRLLRAFSLPNKELPAAKCGTLMSIAVDPHYQNQGLGKKLIEDFLMNASEQGLEYINLTTDARNNDATNLFYCSLGFKFCSSYITQEGRAMNEYLIHLK